MRTKLVSVLLGIGLMFFAPFAIAQEGENIEIGIENTNNITSTGGSANAQQSQDQRQQQAQQQITNLSNVGNSRSSAFSSSDNNLSITTPLQLLPLQYGTGFIDPSIPIPGGEWILYHSAIYSHFNEVEVERMKRSFRFSDLWPGNWKTHLNVSVIGESRSFTASSISIMNYWPHYEINPGDKVLVEINVNGDANMPVASFIGMAASECMAYGSNRMAVMGMFNLDHRTSGFSVSLGGAVAHASGNNGTTATSGGQIGTNYGMTEKRPEYQVLCMNEGSLDILRKESITQVVTPPPPPLSSCNPIGIWREIEELWKKIALCNYFCFNNLQLRAALGEKYIELAVCTGDKKYFSQAITEGFEVAERNFKNGKDISAHRVEAEKIMQRVYYLQAGALNQIYGLQTATEFANKHGLEKFPRSFQR